MRQVQRVAILGPGGAGKSVLARRLGAAWGLPVRHLDAAYWAPGWRATPPELWREVVSGLAAADSWIIEGGYPEVLDLVLARAELAVVLDLPRRVTLRRLLLRPLRRRDRDQGDLPRGMRHTVDGDNLAWAWRWPARDREATLEAVADFAADGGQAVILESPAAVREWRRAPWSAGAGAP